MKGIITKSNRKEIFYNLINAFLAALLVFFGSFMGGNITIDTAIGAFIAAVIVALTQFKGYWDGEKKEYTLFNFH